MIFLSSHPWYESKRGIRNSVNHHHVHDRRVTCCFLQAFRVAGLRVHPNEMHQEHHLKLRKHLGVLLKCQQNPRLQTLRAELAEHVTLKVLSFQSGDTRQCSESTESASDVNACALGGEARRRVAAERWMVLEERRRLNKRCCSSSSIIATLPSTSFPERFRTAQNLKWPSACEPPPAKNCF